jgi:branched-chain amino acid transport system permease protein
MPDAVSVEADSAGGKAPAATALNYESGGPRPPAWKALPRALWPFAAGIVLAAALHFFVQPAIGGFNSTLLMFAGINVILAVSLTVVNGFTGQFSIGHAGFMSLGGYAAAAIVYYVSFRLYPDAVPKFHGGIVSWTSQADFSGPLVGSGDFLFLGACLVAGFLAAGVGWLVGLPSLRLRGDYLAIVTLGFGEIVRVIFQATPDQYFRADRDVVGHAHFLELFRHLGGSLGFIYVPTYATVFWIWAAVFITLIATVRLKLSSYGRALLSVREDAIAAQAMGVNVTRYKVRAFMYGAFFAGIAGALYALRVPGSINAGELAFQKSFDIVIMVVLGGLGSVSGAALAAIILTVLAELLRDPPSLWPWGLVIAAVVAALVWALAERKRGPLITLAVACALWEGGRRLAISLGVNLADYRMIIYALVLIVVMIVRPEGLFGVREVWDYLPSRWRWWQKRTTTSAKPQTDCR